MTDQDAVALAVDVGGTKLAVGLVSAEGKVMRRVMAPVRNNHDPDELFHQLERLVATVGPFDACVVCGVGCGGPMEKGGARVSPLNIPAWRDFPLRAKLAQVTGLPTYVDNDAKALALAEGWVGAAQEQPNFMAMVVSTGIGGGIVLDGRLLQGQHGNAGHVGHVVVAVPGRPLVRHVTGVLEAEASGTAIAAHTGRPPADATPTEIDEVGRYVGRAAGSVANLLDLPLILVAGSVAFGYGDRFFTAAQAEIDRICQLDFSQNTRIAPAGCGDRGPLIGAAAVGLANLGYRLGSVVID